MPVCPECLSRDMVKFGKYSHQQKWHCNHCGLTTIRPFLRMPIRRSIPRKSKKKKLIR